MTRCAGGLAGGQTHHLYGSASDALSGALAAIGVPLHEPEDPNLAFIAGRMIASVALPMLLWRLWSRHKLVWLLGDHHRFRRSLTP